MANARDLALHILHRVETQQSYATELLDQVARDPALAERDRALVQQLVKGTLSQRSRLDALLNDLVRTGVSKLTPWIRNILRMGAYQILELDRIPPEAAVNEAVNLARRYGHSGTVKLVNAVLRKVALQAVDLRRVSQHTDSPDMIAEQYSHPLWLVQRWLAQSGVEATIALCEANNRPWPTVVRTNSLRTTTPALRQQLDSDGIAWQPGRYDPDCTVLGALPGETRLHTLAVVQQGWCTVQDESFSLVSRLVEPQPGEFVVDLCSAPGSKTTHLAALMHNQGRILAVDLHERRLRMVRDQASRLGATIIDYQAGDARQLSLGQLADRILIDAPCSGTGVLGRHSDARWNKKETDIATLAALQDSLLNHAISLVRPGGRLVYATCTLEPEENQGVVQRFLAAHPHARLLPINGIIAPDLIDPDGYFRSMPHLHGIGGAFAAVIEV